MRRVAASILWILTFLVLNTMAWSFTNLLLAGTRASIPLSESVAIGVQRGMEECQNQFRWDPWNCPRNAFTIFSKKSNPPATREKAFIHAIISAGITYTLTRNCSMGHFEACSCDKTKRGNNGKGWTWGGCSDNVRFGERTARDFLDAREPSTNIDGLVNLHNNKVGRWAVKKTMKKTCKCHGVSGSCATVTCWMRLSDMRTIGNRLRRAFERAQRLEYNHNNLGSSHIALQPGVTLHKKNTLVYSTESMNFCQANATAGNNGTRGRECSLRKGKGVSKAELSSCKRLCYQCGLGIRTEVIIQKSSCNCKFIWCCEVKCDECVNKVLRTFCD